MISNVLFKCTQFEFWCSEIRQKKAMDKQSISQFLISSEASERKPKMNRLMNKPVNEFKVAV